jgi:hypothetical protein
VPWVLDIKGSGGGRLPLLAFPSHNGLNEQWTLIDCTHPADLLNAAAATRLPVAGDTRSRALDIG